MAHAISFKHPMMSLPEYDPRVWIVGAGLQGCAIALELAHRGQAVVLLDQDPLPMNRASLRNEGKIHLGLIYAADESGATARIQLRGALAFLPLLARWLGQEAADALPLSTPFAYLVARDSVLAPAELARHFDRLQALYEHWCAEHPEARYLGQRPARLAWPAARSEHEGLALAPGESLFSTAERAIDTDALASAVRAAVLAHPLIDWRPGRRVSRFARQSGGVSVHGQVLGSSGEVQATFESHARQVVNATWEQRLGLDASMGMPPAPGWLHRLKYRVIVRLPAGWERLSSVTMVLGRYGDVVMRPNGTAFVSWYPEGLRGWSEALVPPADWDGPCRGRVPSPQAQALAAAILHAADRWYPGLSRAEVLTVDAGAIFAYGRQDVDQRGSGLHARALNGPSGDARYLSVDSGKLTTAPWYAMQAADVLTGQQSPWAQAWTDPVPAWTDAP
jgi:glycine/D-amino acid oxidase-like deaminating enzyme